MTTQVIKNRARDLDKALRTMAKREVLVGIPSDSADNDRSDDPELTNADIGMINEFGAPGANIPARPHLIPGIDAIRPEAARRLSKAAERILKLRESPGAIADNALESVGILGRDAVVQKINDVLSPALAPATLAARKRQGFEGETPLIVTGAYKQSITYVVDDVKS